MTPLEALIKNILTISILILPLTLFKDFIDETRKINPLVVTGLSSSLLMFVLLPQSSTEITGSNVAIKNLNILNILMIFLKVINYCAFSPQPASIVWKPVNKFLH